MTRQITRSFACTLALLAGACAAESAGPGPADAAAGQSPQCLIPSDYGALGTKTGAADVTAPNSLSIVLDAGPPRDNLFVRLIAGNGALAGGLRTGTFAITGADASLATCGVCTTIIADIVAGQGPSKFYYPDSGSVTITSTSPLAGSAQNLTFVEIDAAGQPVSAGCAARLASITFGS